MRAVYFFSFFSDNNPLTRSHLSTLGSQALTHGSKASIPSVSPAATSAPGNQALAPVSRALIRGSQAVLIRGNRAVTRCTGRVSTPRGSRVLVNRILWRWRPFMR